jgi:starch-binding outer membrane protein, SusD/RagB family
MRNFINKTYKLFILSGVLLTASSCNDFLDLGPRAERVESNFYKSESDANEALVAVYDALQWHTVIGNHPVPMLTDIASDDAYAGGGSRTDAPNLIQMDKHNINPTNGENYGLWRKGYIGISRANVLLERIEGVKASEDFKKGIAAQAKFLRAYFYLDLVRFFENVPLITKSLTASDPAQPQATPAAIFNQIATDLEEAMIDLPEQTLMQSQGRATKWAAKALLARAYLFYKGVYNSDIQAGAVTVDQARALQHLEDIINSGDHSLLANFADNFTKAGEFSNESVFEISYSDKNPWYDWGYIQGGEGNMQAQMQGPRFKEPGKELYELGWSFATVTLALVDAFEANDPRKEATLLSQSEFKGDITIGYQHTGFFSKKYTTLKEYKGATGQQELNWGNNYRSIRYSDVLLMAAELGSPKAQDYLDEVRGRVGLESVPATLDNIFKERRVELALEGHRYWDLLRRGVSVASSAITISGVRGENFQGDQPDFDVTFNPATKGFFPIPQSEIDITSGVVKKNDGY